MKIVRRLLIPIILLSLVIAMVFVAFFQEEDTASAAIGDDVVSHYVNNSVLVIDDISDWQKLTTLPSGYVFTGKTLVLNCDIDLAMYPYPSLKFNGVFEGNGHKALNAKAPLFLELGATAIVRNLHFYNVNIIGRAAIATTNKGTIQNVSASGSVSGSLVGGLVFTNEGTLIDSVSYVTINDTTTTTNGNFGGVAGQNLGIITNSHFFGKMNLTNNVNAGGITSLNVSLVEKCYAKIDLLIRPIKAIDSMSVGGLIGTNGHYPSHLGIVKNSYAFVVVRYDAVEPLNFTTRALVVGGLIGKSVYTDMTYCYSDISGEGNIFGIISHTEAKPITELVVPEEPDEPYYITIDYDFYGSEGIQYCYSVADLARELVWNTHSGTVEEFLPLNNEQITHNQLLNNDITNLVTLLQNPDAVWLGEEGQFPFVCNTLFNQLGTELSPFKIEKAEDILKLKAYLYNQPLNYWFSQQADINFYAIENTPLDMGMSFAGNYNGNDFALHNYSAEALFQKNIGFISNLGFIGGNDLNTIVTDITEGTISNSYTPNTRYGSLYTQANIFGGRSFVLSETFGYTASHTFVNITKDNNYSSGDGSEANPYVITTASQLSSIGSLNNNQYAILANDIKINSSAVAIKTSLNISGFSGNFDGKGHNLTGLLNEPFIRGALTGNIKNVNIRGIITGLDNTGMLANSVANVASVESVNIYGSVAGNQSGGITGLNEGIIRDCGNFATLSGVNSAGIVGQNQNIVERSQNLGLCPIGITNNSSNGTITNCFDQNSQAIYNGVGLLNSSIRKTATSIELWHDNTKVYDSESLPINQFRTFTQYSLSVWGYDIGTNSLPELKLKGRIYKNDIAQSYFSKILNNNRTYSPLVSTIISTIEYDLVIKNSVRSQITFEWQFNGVPFDKNTNPYIINAGVYRVLAHYPGDNYTFAYTHSYTVTIARAALPMPDFWGGGVGIDGVHRPYIYDGEVYNLYQIKAFNLDSIGITEGDYSYAVTKSGQAQPNIINAGSYNVAITINNINYTIFSSSTIVEVSKANLVVNMHDSQTDYLSEKPEFTYGINVQTNLNSDEERVQKALTNAQNALSGANAQALCYYDAGDDIGEYEIDFIALGLLNYNVTVNKGKLTIKPIPLTAENITYEDAEEVYTGYALSIQATINDQTITVEYSELNNNINVGEYHIVAVFAKHNYTAIELSATLRIIPAPLAIKPKDKEITYLSSLPSFEIGTVAFLGNDTISALTGLPFFVCNYTQGDDIGAYDISMSGMSAQNYNISYEKGTLNVLKAYMNGLFVYENVSYIYDGGEKTHPIDLQGYSVGINYLYYKNDVLLSSVPVDSGVYSVTAFVQPVSNNHRSTPFSSTMTIAKANISVSFLPNYAIDYDGEYHNIDFEGELPSPQNWTVAQTGRNAQLQLFSSFKDAGNYNVTTVFSGDPNYNNKTLTTTLTINKKQLNLNIPQNTIYNRQNQTPIYDFDGEIVEGDMVEISWKYSLLGYGYEFAMDNVINAGSYTTYPVSLNNNYHITNNPVFTIARLQIFFVPNYVEFSYGDYTDFVYNSRSFTSGRTFIIQRNYYIDQTNQSVDVEYFYSGPAVGTYNVTGIRDTANYDFELSSGSGTNKIRVVRRDLTHIWNETSLTREYNGSVQQPFTVTIGNVLSGESVSTIIKSDGNLKDVGNYSVWVELSASPNYRLESTLVYLEITKAPLTIRANDISVIKGTKSVSYSYSITGLKGLDSIVSLGSQVVYNCSYTENSPTGITLPISISEFTLDNYIITFVIGVLTVTSNQYSTMSMSSRNFVYDGNMKALTLNQSLPQGAVVSYQNNFKTNAGVYSVTANVIFPNSTTQTLTATLTITKVTPTVFVEDLLIPYSIVAKLKNNDIIGVAMVNDNEIEGSFSFTASDKSLRSGINEYEIMFSPTNSENINAAFATINVEGKAVRDEVLSFDIETVVVTEKNIYLTEEATLTLSEVYDNTQLYLNGQPVDSINLNVSGQYKIDVRYDGNLVYSKTFTVTLQKDGDNEDITIPEGEAIFVITGGTFEENGIILIEEYECFIAIVEEYTEMELFLNGQSVEFIVLYGNEETARIQVKYKGLLIYSRTLIVEKVPEETTIETPKMDRWLWAKVLGGILGGIGIGALAFLIIKKQINKRKKVYNPYVAVEKKKNKFKKYQ